jgi:hypothetical protein
MRLQVSDSETVMKRVRTYCQVGPARTLQRSRHTEVDYHSYDLMRISLSGYAYGVAHNCTRSSSGGADFISGYPTH